jgi:eukaryotic-like serine/threonine-protein kinase
MPDPRRIDPNRLPGGTTLGGRYRVDGPVGAGGMARVYAGWDPLLERKVALKVAATDLSQDPDARERFAAEARTAASVSHPGLVAVFDAGVERGVPYLVLEYVEGRTLARVIREDGITWQRAVAIAADAADALGAIHARGFVHRDVKPGNILVAGDGTVKVADFGIAGAMRSSAAAGGQVHGTPGYAAPEQLRGEPVDGRADVFSLGVALFELLAGRLPFGAGQEVSAAGPVLPPRDAPAISPAVDAAVRVALSVRPEDRFATAGAFRDALLDAAEGAPTSPLAPTPAAAGRHAGAHRVARRGRVARTVTVAAVLILVLAGAWVAAGTPFLDRPVQGGGPTVSPSPRSGRSAPAAIAPRTEPPIVAGGETPAPGEGAGEDGDADQDQGTTDEPCDNRGPGNCEDRGRDDGGGHSG